MYINDKRSALVVMETLGFAFSEWRPNKSIAHGAGCICICKSSYWPSDKIERRRHEIISRDQQRSNFSMNSIVTSHFQSFNFSTNNSTASHLHDTGHRANVTIFYPILLVIKPSSWVVTLVILSKTRALVTFYFYSFRKTNWRFVIEQSGPQYQEY